jgi:Fic family protein
MSIRKRADLAHAGACRTSGELMQVASGSIGSTKIRFEAPPAAQVPSEMARFIEWFERTGPGGSESLPAFTRAGTSHLCFESIHPFEDGNGRIGRAIAEKSLAQNTGQPTFVALAATILARRANYYNALEMASTGNEITQWLAWFGCITLEAWRRTLSLIDFLIEKTKLLDRLSGQMNERLEKVLLRIFREGSEGFRGGLSAGKYSTITQASPATVTRDLSDLVEKGALVRSGERRYARYQLAAPLHPVRRVTIGENGQLTEM